MTLHSCWARAGQVHWTCWARPWPRYRRTRCPGSRRRRSRDRSASSARSGSARPTDGTLRRFPHAPLRGQGRPPGRPRGSDGRRCRLPGNRADQRLRWTARGGGPGTPVLISDHINLTATSPLEGPTFVDLTDLYAMRLREIARQVDPSLAEGVYVQFPGPQYETPAEVRMARAFGGDLVGCRPPSRPSPPARRAWRCWASRWSRTWPPGSARNRLATPR